MGPNQNTNGFLFVKDSDGNWVPVCQITNADITETNTPNPLVKINGEITVTGEITLSEEAAAAWWSIAQGGIEIVER